MRNLAICGLFLVACTGPTVTGTSTTGSDSNAAAVSSYTGPVPTINPGVVDPGVRGGPPGAGTPIAGLNANELALFNEGKFRTVEEEATCDTCNDIPQGQPIPADAPVDTTNSAGLGGRFNHTSCTLGCHSQPTIGGSSPAVNPSFAAAKAKGATNVVPSFETIDGPTREVRFKFNADGTRDGSVNQKFTVTGRSDAPNCTLAQPDFETEYTNDNLSFRQPTPLFGLGLIDSIQDNEILAHQEANADYKASLGIHGITNNSPNDATISRFGWKAQNKSLTQFAGEAYAVELGITNDLNPTSKTEDDNCTLTEEPSDLIHTGDGTSSDTTNNFNVPIDVLPVWMTFTTFMRFMDQPTPVAFDDSATRGSNTFNQIGCAECHTPSMQIKGTGQVPQTVALRGQTANLFSDLLIHHMGSTLADNVVQGNAGPDMFRTAPLWGLGQRIFFLHDGRETDLVATIFDHFSKKSSKSGVNPAYPASEANQVVANFFALSADDQQDVINFLRSL